MDVGLAGSSSAAEVFLPPLAMPTPSVSSVLSAILTSSMPSPTSPTTMLPTTSSFAIAAEAINGTNTTAATASCQYEEPPLTTLRFWVVSVFGTSIALISIVTNMFFSYLFATRKHHRTTFNLKHHRTTFNLYMMFISLFDIFISISYILIQSMNVLMDFLQSLTLFRIWHIYMVPFLTISHCAITSGSFLILAATIERYLLTKHSRYIRWVQRNRHYIILFAILIGILSKVTICLEFQIDYNEACANTMSEIDIKFADFVFGTDYHLYWRFYYRNFVTIFFPFFALLILNAKIISVLARYEKENYKFQMLHSSAATAKQIKRKKVTRAATITTILIVCTYLVSNIISVALTTWEHIDKASLVGEYVQIYFISIDLSSLLTVCSCAFRPLIYLICQPGLRNEVFYLFKRLFRLNAGDAYDPKSGAHGFTTVFDQMYNSVDLSSCMQASPATPATGDHSFVQALCPKVPRMLDDAKQVLLLQSNGHNNICNGKSNNNNNHNITNGWPPLSNNKKLKEKRQSLCVGDSNALFLNKRNILLPANGTTPGHNHHQQHKNGAIAGGYRRCSNGGGELLRGNIVFTADGNETHL